jgi:hypothetical protein
LSNIEEEVQNVISDCNILECEGAPHHSWTTKCVSLHNDNGILVVEGICYSVKSDLVVGSIVPLGDTHVAIRISRNHKADEFPKDWKCTVQAWHITHVFYNGASLFNHERRHKFKCRGLNHGEQSG